MSMAVEIKDEICLFKSNMTLSYKHTQKINEGTAEKHVTKCK